MANFTGFSPDQAKTQIRDFYSRGVILTRDFEEVEEVFIFSLYDSWYSPKAKEFGEKYSLPLYNVGNKARITLFNICVDAQAAYNAIATSNGAPTMADDYFVHGSMDEPSIASNAFSIGLREIGPNGDIGMDIPNVKAAVENLKNGIEKLIAGLEDLPLDIAFYDPNGELKAAYKNEITKVVNEITDLANSIYKDVDEAISEEERRIEEAKNSAAQEMSN